MPLWFPEEKVLRQVILPELERGRPNWDRPHTEAVVYWMKQLLKQLPGLNRKVLVTAAYAHDWGYVGMFPDRTYYDSVQQKKADHMRVGASKIYQLIKSQFSNITEKEAERVRRLVGIHDQLDKLKAEDELALMEADTLGALDSLRVKPTFLKDDNRKYMEEVYKWRRPLFIHNAACRFFDKLSRRREEYYDSK